MSTTANTLSFASKDVKVNIEEAINKLKSMIQEFNPSNDPAGLKKISYLAAIQILAAPKSYNAIFFNDCELTDEHLDLIFAILEKNSNELGTIQFGGNQKFSIKKLEQHIIQLFTKNPNASHCLTLPPEIAFKPIIRRFWNENRKGNSARILSPEPAALLDLGMGRGQLTKEEAIPYVKANMELIQQKRGHLNFHNCLLTDQDLEVLFKDLIDSNGSFSQLNLTGNHLFSMEVLSNHIEKLFAYMKQKNPNLLLCLQLPYELETNQSIKNTWSEIVGAWNACRLLSFEPEPLALLRRFLKANPSMTGAMIINAANAAINMQSNQSAAPIMFTNTAISVSTAATNASMASTASTATMIAASSATGKSETTSAVTTISAEKPKVNG